MKKVKSTKPQQTKFRREYQMQVGNFNIVQGDIIKIDGMHGDKFKFDSVVTNIENGLVWIDCFEMQKSVSGVFRSYSLERVKRVPTKRGRRKKNVD